MQPQTFVFFGIMGSGKGTQIKLLETFLKGKEDKDIIYAGTGEEFRKLIGSGSFTGNKVKELHDNGILVPDFITNTVITDIFISRLESNKHLIMDGYPRTILQSENFDNMMKFYERKNIKIIYIKVGKEEAKRRNLLRGRKDDTEEGISKRIEMFFNDVVPAIEYFKGKQGYEFLEINGEQTIEEVNRDIIKALNL